MSGIRKSFSGAAAATTLNGQINSGALAAVLNAITNFPDTTVGPFVGTLDRGLSTEEKVLCSSYTGLTVTIAQRGYDGTIAQAHANGATFECTLDANTVDQANDIVNGVGSVTPSTSAVGDSASKGVDVYPAAADHTHGRENFAAGATTNVGTTSSDGVSTSPARADHVHGGATGGGGTVGVSWPIGMSGMWPGPSGTIPSGFLPCDGRTLSRTTFSALYTALGGGTSPWGQGDGSTTFAIPLVSAGSAPVQQGGSYGLGVVGGSATQTLTTAHMPHTPLTIVVSDSGHSHGVSDPGHVHSGAGGGNAFAILPVSSTLQIGTTGGTPITFTENTDTATTGVSVNSASTGITATASFGSISPTAVPTQSPWVGMNFVIRAI